MISAFYFIFSSLSFFGHFSHRSEWQLIKIDYMGLFSRRCMDGDYQTWYLHNKVTRTFVGVVFVCVFLEQSIFRVSARPVKTQSCLFLFDRESCVWWVRSRSIWSAGLAIVACWLKIIPGSTPQSRVSAQLMILNGDDTYFLFPQNNIIWNFLLLELQISFIYLFIS